ncbi:MAG: M23 family metallopeptidase [Bacilli bacterium]|nr:M23 family metallopeptidase [Bacilli bacterium]
MLLILFIIFLILLISTVIFGSPSITLKLYFTAPFEELVDYTITSKYGERIDPFTNKKSFHSGIDLAASDGTNIVASYKGYVIEAGYEEEGLGEYVVIEHNIEGIVYRTTYGHILKDSTIVTVGEKVETKQKIAIIGSTGKSTGTHVHFMVNIFKNGKETLINPNDMFE